MKTVFFDFDCTLTTKDTIRPFIHHITPPSHFHKIVLLYLALIVFRLKLANDDLFKKIILILFFKNKNTSEVENLVDSFIHEKLPELLNRKVLLRLTEHVQSGDKVYIASANFDFLIKRVGKLWGVADVFATESELVNDRYTGNLIGASCKGEKKVKRLGKKFGKEKLQGAIAYLDQEDKILQNHIGTCNFVDAKIRH